MTITMTADLSLREVCWSRCLVWGACLGFWVSTACCLACC